MHDHLQILARRLSSAKRRCNHDPAYRHVAFEFASPRVGAQQLFEKLGPLPCGASLDRIDPHGPYSLSNLRYASARVQSWNRRCIRNGWRRAYAQA